MFCAESARLTKQDSIEWLGIYADRSLAQWRPVRTGVETRLAALW